LSVRQFLTERLIDSSFNQAVLYSIGSGRPVRYPLPKEWRDELSAQGLLVDRFYSSILWRAHGFFYLLKGVLHGVLDIFFQVKSKRKNLKNYVYFNDLNNHCLSTDPDQKNIVNWYLKWRGRNENIENICHNVSNRSEFKIDGSISVFSTDAIPDVRGFELLRYAIFFVYYSITCFLYLPFRPLHGFFLHEALKLRRTELSHPNSLAQDYLFHNSTPFYRPIWSYEAEKKGSRILFYFYSTNSENFQKGNSQTLENPWHLISWPYCLVWDEYQAKFVERFAQHNATIECVGPIWFSSSENISNIPVNSISVFDVFPRRDYMYWTLGLDFEYYTPQVANRFLSDVYLVASENNIVITHKIKRFSKFVHKKYMRQISLLGQKKGYVSIDPNVSAYKVIESSRACVSMPFTSTALIAKYENKPSVFYDPTGVIKKDDKAAHGIPVLTGVDELREWMCNLERE